MKRGFPWNDFPRILSEEMGILYLTDASWHGRGIQLHLDASFLTPATWTTGLVEPGRGGVLEFATPTPEEYGRALKRLMNLPGPFLPRVRLNPKLDGVRCVVELTADQADAAIEELGRIANSISSEPPTRVRGGMRISGFLLLDRPGRTVRWKNSEPASGAVRLTRSMLAIARRFVPDRAEHIELILAQLEE